MPSTPAVAGEQHGVELETPRLHAISLNTSFTSNAQSDESGRPEKRANFRSAHNRVSVWCALLLYFFLSPIRNIVLCSQHYIIRFWKLGSRHNFKRSFGIQHKYVLCMYSFWWIDDATCRWEKRWPTTTRFQYHHMQKRLEGLWLRSFRSWLTH